MWIRLRKILLRYGIALAAITAVALFKVLLGPAMLKAPAMPFIVSIIVAAWYGGMGPGLFAAGGCIYVINQFFSPQDEMDLDRVDLLRAVTFVSVSAAVSWLRDARVRAESALKSREQQQAVVARLGQHALSGAAVQELADEAVRLVSTALGGANVWVRSAHESWRSHAIFTNGEHRVAGRHAEPGTPAALPGEVMVSIRNAGTAWGALGARILLRRQGSSEDDLNFLQAIANVLSTTLDQRRAEQALRESEARTRAILATAADGIVTVDENGRVESVNPAAERLFGHSAAELLGRSGDLLLAEPFRDHFSAFLRLARRHAIGQANHVNESGRSEDKVGGTGDTNGTSTGAHNGKAGTPLPFAGSSTREIAGLRRNGEVFPMDLAVSVVPMGDRTLLTGVARDATERKQLEREILAISDRERRRIGQDLHDGLGQHLAGIAFMSSALRQKLVGKSLGEANDADKIDALVNQAIVHTRSLARGLYPVELQRGLGAALIDLSANIRQVFGIACRCDCALELTVAEATAAHLYRIAQEAINNAIKHGRAPQVLVSLNLGAAENAKGHVLTLRIEDNGIGFSEPPDAHLGMGLRIMEYRSRMIGGTLRIQRGSAGGTVVSCAVPTR